MLRRVRCFSCREYYPIQGERILLRLLIAASSFLDAARGGDPDGLAMARTIAFRACDWACPDCPDDWAELKRAGGGLPIPGNRSILRGSPWM
jgi:hypothetical protein